MDSIPANNLSLNTAEDWPYGYGNCCCGCGKKTTAKKGVLQKYYLAYHERWAHGKKQNPLPESKKADKPKKNPATKQLPDEFQISQAEVNITYSNLDNQTPTTSEREKRFPHLNAPTVQLKHLLKQPVNEKPETDRPVVTQPNLFGDDEKPDRLKQQLAWIKKNQSLLGAISRARDRVDTAINGARIRRREKADIDFRLLQRMRARVSAVLGGRLKSSSTLEFVGCTLTELKAHLEKQFKAGMSWSNYGEWHVDHIRPCASFDFSDPNSFSQCFHYSNLQPMWGADNYKKNSTWEGNLIRRKKQE